MPSRLDRGAQFEYINKVASEYLVAKQPVISLVLNGKEYGVDSKKRRMVYSEAGESVEALECAFPTAELEQAKFLGVVDILKKAGFFGVGICGVTAEFAVASIRKWWYEQGCERYADTRGIYITVDSSGSDEVGIKLWRVRLQELSNELGLEVRVSHFPVGIYKWNKLESRLFSFIRKTWQGKPFISLVAMVDLVGGSTFEGDLTVRCAVDQMVYRSVVGVSDEVLARVNLRKEVFLGDWNYSILPHL
ncbi:MAG: ISAzo13 family transposase [Nitrososphaerota archaeon]|nr:ISAzo13 family transposase [Nitrososphaerota archaeon]